MRALPALVAVESLTLLFLFMAWLQPDAASPQAAIAAQQDDAAATVAPATTGSAPATANDATNVAVREAAANANAASATVILQGRLLGTTPPFAKDTVNLWLESEGRFRSATITATGAYAVSGLTPGAWHLRCEARGYRRIELDPVLGNAPVQRIDLSLEPAPTLSVFATTTDGKPLAKEIASNGVPWSFTVVATPQPLTGDYAPTEASSMHNVGVGRYRPTENRREEPGNEPDGTLELDQAPPVNAALLLRHMVIAQQRIEPGQRELRFQVDGAALLAKLPNVRVRVLGPAGPIQGARISLSTSQGGGQSGKTDAQGVATIPRVLPGLAHLELHAKDAEDYTTHVLIPTTAEHDLGDLQLTTGANLRGRVVDAEGKGVLANLEWTALDLWRPPAPTIDRRSSSTEHDGSFELFRCGRRQYLVTAHTAAGLVGHAIVDGAAAAPSATIVVQPGCKLTLDASRARDVRCVAIRDPRGTLVRVCRIDLGWPKQSVQLPAGEYQLQVHDGLGRPVGTDTVRLTNVTLTKELP